MIWSLVEGDDGGQHWGSLLPSEDWSWLGSDGSSVDGVRDYRGSVGDHVGRGRSIGQTFRLTGSLSCSTLKEMFFSEQLWSG